MKKEIARQYIGKRGYVDNSEYRESMIHMRFEPFSEEDMLFFKELYLTSKDIFTRNQILQAFVLQCLQYDLKDFFLLAFKKERYLDMRLIAIRGFAAYATEKEIIPLMKKFLEILIKIPTHTPYNYEEYEILRSKFGLPYLVEKYGYSCFKEAFAQLEKQYNDMADECKGFFTLDKNGLHVSLMSSEEISKKLNILFKRK
ncbi:MAG: hypothetical protein FWC41_12125 [Firmicutes bacterium]|nr:hypothetical protein [Bacillota bacterium]MCL2313205.1 hypothetical protein [Bacillota bacterium]